MNIGDSVTINAKYSTFDRMQGVITEIVEGTALPFTVKFDSVNDADPVEECYFSEEELV